ncbi:hypothetical protein JVT61DRAFT_11916 [Boletus reticuloceps]|uniref:Uncharacterized protein n=1 Tax=Boletus reticuloceps TaxID=495285 RepID=A0A8I3ABQ3_9AGAM|nr:hypothetical protein JVT61DRAFT_11916 [Boletus reticuloceps]
MSVFEPKVIASLLRNSCIVQPGEQEKFRTWWSQSVDARVGRWNNLPATKASNRPLAQLKWEAEVVEYVTLLWNAMRCHSQKATTTKTLGFDVPILGPRFIPPTHLHSQLRPGPTNIQPDVQYLKPINIIHPLHYPELARCPRCLSCDNVSWEGWTTTGPRELHGISHEETALRLQLRCNSCKRSCSGLETSVGDVTTMADGGETRTRGLEGVASSEPGLQSNDEGNTKDGSYCFALTSHVFWKGWNHWEIPGEIPIFYKRCALTHELFNLVVEIRPSTTSAGLAEQLKHERKWAYLKAVQREQSKATGTAGLAKFGITANMLKPFSTPDDPQGYADKSISHEVITEVFLDFSGRTRQAESQLYLRSLPTRCGSIDSTFKSASKATITDSHCRRSKELRGGILSMINEKGKIVAWRLCQTKANAEITELLMGIRCRPESMGLPMPEMMVTDNCCQVRRAVESALPEADCILDICCGHPQFWKKHTYHAAVAADITSAVLKKRSVKGSGAEYWSKEEQEQRLEAAFAKWAEKGTVWSAAAMQVHKDQLNHVRKGCLERRRQDIPSDGSHIKGSHKGWNAVVAHSGGSRLESPFLASAHGSHHISLVSAITSLHNGILKNNPSSGGLECLPELANIPSGETFGLITSDHTSTFGGLIDIKEELTELDDAAAIVLHSLEFEHDTTTDLALQASRPILEGLNIDPWLLNEPATGSPTAANVATAAKRKSESVLPVDRVGRAALATAPSFPTIEDSSVKTAPVDLDTAPPVAKRARLGSRSEAQGWGLHCAMPARPHMFQPHLSTCQSRHQHVL